MSFQFTREMQWKRGEFLRELPRAIEHLPHRKENDERVVVEYEDRRIEIDAVELDKREMGALELPQMKLTFTFHNFSEDEMKEFMERFDQHTLRVGGGP